MAETALARPSNRRRARSSAGKASPADWSSDRAPSKNVSWAVSHRCDLPPERDTFIFTVSAVVHDERECPTDVAVAQPQRSFPPSRSETRNPAHPDAISRLHLDHQQRDDGDCADQFFGYRRDRVKTGSLDVATAHSAQRSSDQAFRMDQTLIKGRRPARGNPWGGRAQLVQIFSMITASRHPRNASV